MVIGIPLEKSPKEYRISAIPSTVKEFIKSGHSVLVEQDAGTLSSISDSEFIDAGAEIITSSETLYKRSELILKVNPLDADEIQMINHNSTVVSFIQTTRSLEVVKQFLDKKITGFSMHLIPRTTLAQKMDALSSQSNIAGYKSVIMGANHLSIYMPLLMTAAGTIKPAKVLILGAGVAGLQAIATAKRLGAQVEAFDVRAEVKEQVESLGAKFVEVEFDPSEGSGKGGYAKETTEDYQKRQSELITQHIAKSDMVITTALIPGRPAPKLISTAMVEGMKTGSVIMDLAAENGGNCDLTIPDEVITHHGVIIDGTANIPSTMPVNASQLYAKNMASFINHIFPEGKPELDLEDEIVSGAMFTYQGKITDQRTQEAMETNQ